MLKNYWYVPLLLFCAWFWLKEHDKLVLAQAQISAIADSSKTELKALDSVLVASNKKDEIIRAANEQLVRHIRVDSLKQVSVSRTTDSLVSLLSKTPDSLEVRSLQQSFESERLSFTSQIADYSKQVANLKSIISSKDSTINSQQLAINDLNGRLGHLVKIQKPGTLSKIASGIPYLAVGYILGKSI